MDFYISVCDTKICDGNKLKINDKNLKFFTIKNKKNDDDPIVIILVIILGTEKMPI